MRAVAGLLMLASSCAPLTFSNEPPVDFERYEVVFVAPVRADAGFDGSAYLAAELEASSGFSEVATSPRAIVDLVLEVEVDVWRLITIEDGVVDVDYESRASFRALTVDGRVIDAGVVEDYSSSSEREAVEDALDAVAHHYLVPYRV